MDEKNLTMWRHRFYATWAEAKYNEKTFQEEMWKFNLQFAKDFSSEKLTMKQLFKLIWTKILITVFIGEKTSKAENGGNGNGGITPTSVLH